MIAAELHTTPFGRRKRSLRAFADPATLVLSDHCHNADGQAVRLRHVGSHEGNASLFEAKEEMGVTGQTIEFRDNELAPSK